MAIVGLLFLVVLILWVKSQPDEDTPFVDDDNDPWWA